MESEDQYFIQLEVDINTLRLLHFALDETHKRWCGSEPYDQTHIKACKDSVYCALMDSLLATKQI